MEYTAQAQGAPMAQPRTEPVSAKGCVLETMGIVKEFSGVRVLNSISLGIRRGRPSASSRKMAPENSP